MGFKLQSQKIIRNLIQTIITGLQIKTTKFHLIIRNMMYMYRYVSLYENDIWTMKIPFYIPYVQCIKTKNIWLTKIHVHMYTLISEMLSSHTHKKTNKNKFQYFLSSTENVWVKSSFRSKELISPLNNLYSELDCQ